MELAPDFVVRDGALYLKTITSYPPIYLGPSPHNLIELLSLLTASTRVGFTDPIAEYYHDSAARRMLYRYYELLDEEADSIRAINDSMDPVERPTCASRQPQ